MMLEARFFEPRMLRLKQSPTSLSKQRSYMYNTNLERRLPRQRAVNFGAPPLSLLCKRLGHHSRARTPTAGGLLLRYSEG
jgi:hypothetical protein